MTEQQRLVDDVRDILMRETGVYTPGNNGDDKHVTVEAMNDENGCRIAFGVGYVKPARGEDAYVVVAVGSADCRDSEKLCGREPSADQYVHYSVFGTKRQLQMVADAISKTLGQPETKIARRKTR